MKSVLLCFISFALLFTAHAAEKPLSDPSVGKIDETGLLVIHVFNAESAPARVHLSTDYGVMMFRSSDGWVRFMIADKAKKSVREFSNYNEYLDALAELPKGSKLTIYDRCLMPRFYDFYPVHRELHTKFAQDCRERGLKLAKNPNITCTCERAAVPAPAKN